MLKKNFMAIVVVLILSAFVTQAAFAAPPFPFEVYGEIVDQDGNNLPDGTVIDCVVDGITFSNVTYTEGGRSQYDCQLLGDDPDTADVVEGGLAGSTVLIQYDGMEIGQTTWKSGETELNVVINLNGTPPTPTPIVPTATPTAVNTPQPTPSPTPVNTPTPPTPTATPDGTGNHGATATLSLDGLASAFIGQSLGFPFVFSDVSGVGIYGVSADCYVAQDGIIQLSYIEFGNLFHSSALPGIDELDLANNRWQGAKSQKNPRPALNSDGVFATLYVETVGTGSAELKCHVRMVDRDGFDIETQLVKHTITVQSAGLGDFNALVEYQSRRDHSGALVRLTGASEQTLTTGSDGLISFSGLAYGNYDLEASALGYLSVCAAETLDAAGVTIADPLTLWAGDTDGSGRVDITDAIAVSRNFDRSANGDLSIDFNADGMTDIADLAALGGNFNNYSNCN